MGKLSNLPTDIILEILTRLPTESVIECKLVCKPWRNLVSHYPSFSKLHLIHLNHLAYSAGKLSFLVKSHINQQLHYFEYNENNDETRIRKINFTPPFTSLYPYYEVIGSFNGLVCLDGWRDYACCICNPVTREYVRLPKVKRDSNDDYIYWSSGFGYVPLTNEYKVVQLYKLRGDLDSVEVMVYTLGSGNGWRNVGRLDSLILGKLAGVFVSGALYWIGARHLVEEEERRLLAFDLTEEKFREHVSLPSSPLETDMLMLYSYFIGYSDGVLCYAIKGYSIITECTCFDIWLLKKRKNILDMKELVENEPLGWSKEFSHFEREPLAITKNGGVLCFKDTLSIYDPVASTSKNLAQFPAIAQIVTHKNTLISLKELGEKDIEIMESSKMKNHKAHELTT